MQNIRHFSRYYVKPVFFFFFKHTVNKFQVAIKYSSSTTVRKQPSTHPNKFCPRLDASMKCSPCDSP